jgi:acyl-CoA thioesterase I
MRPWAYWCLVIGFAALTIGEGIARAAAEVDNSAAPARCSVPADLGGLNVRLERTARHLASGEPLVIAALGSSSTAGAGASSAATSYPTRLELELKWRFPAQPITVLNRGVNGELATDMLARFDKRVAVEHPALVLWQLGTNALLRGHDRWPPDSLIRHGIARMREIGADIVLIDPQFAPKVLVRPELDEMLDLIAAAAREEHVGVFRRFALMRHWREVDDLPFSTFISPDGLHMNDWSYACLARALADAIAEATKP